MRHEPRGRTLHITSGDCAGARLDASSVDGDVFVWHDILYDGPRAPGWPDDEALAARARFLSRATGGGLAEPYVLRTLRDQYRRLAALPGGRPVVLWFDACLFDQAMLAHILACLALRGRDEAELLVVDAFDGVEPYHGLGQLTPAQLASVYPDRAFVTPAQWRFARTVDRAFALQDAGLLADLARTQAAPLPWAPAAAARWLQERPDPRTGLGRLETLALTAVRAGCERLGDICQAVDAAETPPRFWGDTTLWAKINALADRDPPLVRIRGPADRLPQWQGQADPERFRVTACGA